MTRLLWLVWSKPVFGKKQRKRFTPATHLSSGQQQRLFLARSSFVIEPKVTLMDEPTTVLDPIATAKVVELIDSLNLWDYDQ